jgi:hypothetical protein
MVPAGVKSARLTVSGIEWVTRIGSTVIAPKAICSPGM